MTAASLGATADKRRRALEIVEDAARRLDMPTDRTDHRPASGRSRRCARGARARRWRCTEAARARQDRGARLRGLAGRDGGDLPRARPRARGGLRAAGAGRYGGGAAALPRQGAAARVGLLRVAHRAGAARRRACSPRRATRRWPRSSWRRRARRRRRAWSGSACCATSGSPAGRTRPRWRTSTWARRCCASAIARAALRELGAAARHAGGGRRRLRDRRRDRARVRLLPACCCSWARTWARSRRWPRAT